MASAKKPTTKKKKTSAGKAPARRAEPYRKSASTENYTGRITAAFVFLFLACQILVQTDNPYCKYFALISNLVAFFHPQPLSIG